MNVPSFIFYSILLFDIFKIDILVCYLAYCPSGQELKNGTCRNCAIGFWKNNDINLLDACTMCDNGMVTAGTGATTKANCSQGWYMMTSSNGNIFHVTGLCAGNSPVTGEFPSQRLVTRSFGVFFDLRLNKRLSKQSWGW